MISKEDLVKLIRSVQEQIEPSFCAYDGDELPGVLLIIGVDLSGDWGWQTGAPDYYGPAYGYPVQVSIGVYAEDDPEETAERLLLEIEEELAWLEKEMEEDE